MEAKWSVSLTLSIVTMASAVTEIAFIRAGPCIVIVLNVRYWRKADIVKMIEE
jgi:hypothetical protein